MIGRSLRARRPAHTCGKVCPLSFKLKLVAYFLLLTLLPLAAAFAGFSAVVSRSEARLVDAQLQAGLRAGTAAFAEETAAAERTASSFAANEALQQALARFDIATLYQLTRALPSVRVESSGLRIGRRYGLAAERRVTVLAADGRELGAVVASVPFDRALADRLRARSGLQPGQRVALVVGGKIVAASPPLGGSVGLERGRPRTVTLGGTRYRALASVPAADGRGLAIAILSPQSWIDEANRSAKLRLLGALLGSLLLVALVAYLEGRSIVGTLRRLVEAAHGIAEGRLAERVRVRGRDEFAGLGRAFNEMAEQLEARLEDLEAERRRLRDATVRFGEALAVSHDVDQLLRAIVETVVESTRATGGVLLGPEGQVIQVGDPDEGERIQLPLRAGPTSFGTLLLSGREFSPYDVEAATILVGHAVVALENARLHRILERQARLDGLTGLANRRQAEDVLRREVARAARFGTPLTVVVADLDDFKAVNDRHGHPAGDVVMREFAETLQANVREIDLAARWGGEEFVLVLPGTDVEGAVQVAERVRQAIAARVVLAPEGAPIRVTASLGVAAYTPPSSEAELVAAADAALYDAKRSGKDRVAVAASLPVGDAGA